MSGKKGCLLGWLMGNGETGTPDIPNPPSPPPPSGTGNMNKKALLIGINKYQMPGANLNGCVNDVNNMWDILVNKQGFEPDNIRMVTDERATKANILSRLEWLVAGSKAGDLLIFQYSGHGSQVRDRNGDELNDHMDEILCPTDLDWDDPLTDDIVATYFKRIPKGAFLTFICDACHSGTMDRSLVSPNSNPHPTKERFLPPPADILARSRGRDLKTKKVGCRSLFKSNGNVTYSEQRHMLLSGCRDDQTSADAFIDGKYQGAMTASLLKMLKTHPDASWVRVHEEMLKYLSGSFSQVPQLSGPKPELEAKPFSKS